MAPMVGPTAISTPCPCGLPLAGLSVLVLMARKSPEEAGRGLEASIVLILTWNQRGLERRNTESVG